MIGKFIYRFILITIATYAGRTLLAPLTIFGWDIDIGILAVVLIGLSVSGEGTILWGAYSGFIIDCLNPQWMGAGIGARATAALFISAMRGKLNIDHPVLIGFVIFVASLIDRFIYLSLSSYNVQIFYALWRFIIPSALYNAIFAVVIIEIYRIIRLFAK